MRIDWWTLALQTFNVVILVWILSPFLFRPVAAIIEGRRAAAVKLFADAEAAKKQANAAREASEPEATRLASARDESLRAAAAEAERERAAARAEVAQLRAAAEAEIRSARQADASAASDRAARLAVDIAGKLLKRLPDAARVDGFIDGLAQALASLPAASRDGFGAGGTARLTAARSLDEKEMDSCREAFAKALGRPVNFSLSVDSDLVAGLELETPHAVRNSFRGDLSRIVEELTRHDRAQR
jgi:F-type H+-transporting ATPase subunit b